MTALQRSSLQRQELLSHICRAVAQKLSNCLQRETWRRRNATPLEARAHGALRATLRSRRETAKTMQFGPDYVVTWGLGRAAFPQFSSVTHYGA